MALLCIAATAVALPLAAEAKSVLIIDTNDPVNGSPVVTAQSLVLGGLQAAAGNTVTYSGLLLPSLSNFDQIWDIRASTALSGAVQSQYLSFLQGGGSLALIGENYIFQARDDSIIEVATLAGAGKVTGLSLVGHQTVVTPFDGPAPVSTINFHGPGGLSSIGHGQAITTEPSLADPNKIFYGGATFGLGTLDNALTGKLVLFMDSGLFQPENDPFQGSPGAQSLTRNIIYYLGDESVVGGGYGGVAPPIRGGVPESATWALLILGFGLTGAAVRRRSTLQTT